MSTALKKPTADKGTASLVFHYMGDSKFTLFFQETLKLKLAMQGYKKVVLLKFKELDPWLDWSQTDERMADVVDNPTKANIARYLKLLADEGYLIDVWIVGHGSQGSFNVSKGSYGNDEDMTKSEIGDLARVAGYKKLPIRMVWSTLCRGATLNAAWIKAGAKVVAGSRHIYFYPTSFGRFAKEWNKGNVGYGSAIRSANTSAGRTVVQTGLLFHSKGCLREWGGKIWDVNILGKGAAAKKYFTGMWMRKSDWQEGKSGKDNMSYSSTKLLQGDHLVTKRSRPTW